jgi:signal transduction histidine kinase
VSTAPLVALLARLGAREPLDLDAVAEGVAAALGAHAAAVLTSDAHTITAGGVWPGRAADHPGFRLPVGRGVTGLVAASGRPERMAADAPRDPAHRRLLGLRPGEAVARVVTPTRDRDGQVTGVLSVVRDVAQPFAAADLELAQALADLVGLRRHADELVRADRTQRSRRDLRIAQAISAEEAERRRLAYDLHDGVTTALASMSFHLSSAELTMAALADAPPGADPAALGQRFEQVRTQVRAAHDLVDLAYDQTRSAITGLHSLVLSDLGLVPALESLAEATPLPVDLVADPSEAFADLPDHVASALHRITQEALRNVAKHAHASHAVVSLRRVGDVVVLGCTDDGVGFDARATADRVGAGQAAEPGHYGLASIGERCALLGATLRIESLPGMGTTLMVEVPVSPA